jgi:hypothetical protein
MTEVIYKMYKLRREIKKDIADRSYMQHIELIRGNNRYTMHRNNIKQRS